MVKFYVLQIKIKKGKFTLEDVPKRWREAVKEALDSE